MANNDVEPVEGQWLTAVEASQLSIELGLKRTPKTVRRWAQNSVDKPDGRGEVLAKKRDTSFGFEYVIERSSLVEKVEQELEFQRSKGGQTGVDMSTSGSPDARGDEVVEDLDNQGRIEELEQEITELKEQKEEAVVDAKVYKQLTTQLREERKEVMGIISEQGKAIGRLEEQVKALPAPPSPQVEQEANLYEEPQKAGS